MKMKKQKTRMERITQVVVWIMLIAMLFSVVVGSGIALYNVLR